MFGVFNFSLSSAVYSTPVKITLATADGFIGPTCSTKDSDDTVDGTLTINSGSLAGQRVGAVPLDCSMTKYKRGTDIIISGSIPSGILNSGETFTLPNCITTFTIFINSTSCNTYNC